MAFIRSFQSEGFPLFEEDLAPTHFRSVAGSRNRVGELDLIGGELLHDEQRDHELGYAGRRPSEVGIGPFKDLTGARFHHDIPFVRLFLVPCLLRLGLRGRGLEAGFFLAALFLRERG